ncbi:MAG: hypothetical protein J6X22_07590 [Muribaculaceae bacterium]|nr:hypothetical protein [Muribaculaceae bacterium]
MKSRISYLALVLMLAVASILPARADSYKGTMTRQGTKMEYSFSGGVVTDKKLKGQGTTDMIVSINGQVEAGSTVSATYKKLEDYMRNPKDLEVKMWVTIAGKKEKVQDNKGKESAKASYKIPNNATKVEVQMSYTGRMGRFYCFIDWDVVKEISVKNANEISGTVRGIKGGEMHYTFTAGTVLEKKIEKKKGQGGLEYEHAIYKCRIPRGSTVNITCQGKSDMCTMLTMDGSYVKSELLEPFFKTTYQVPSETFIPQHGGNLVLDVNSNRNETGELDVVWEIGDKGGEPVTPKSFNWDDVASDDRCPHCHGQFSNYFLRSLSGGDAVTICNSDQKKTNHKLVDGLSPIYYRDWIITGDDETELILDHCNDMAAMKIMGRSKVLLRKCENGIDYWGIYKGRIVGRHQKSENTPNPFFKMTMCTVQPNGAIYMLVDDHKVSRVFLLKGSIKVKCKTLIFTLKPGQVGTVDENGEAKIQKFDVEAAAKKYSIPLGSGNTTSKKNTN